MKSDINNLLSRVFYAFHFIVLKNCQKISVLLDGENIYLNFHDATFCIFLFAKIAPMNSWLLPKHAKIKTLFSFLQLASLVVI